MFIKKLTLTSILLASLLTFPSCGEENMNTLEPPSGENPNGSGDSNNEDTEETIANGDEIIVDMQSNGGPDIAYWRGAMGPGQNGFFNTDSQRECLSIHAENGMRIYNGVRRLACDEPKGDFYLDKNGNPTTDPIPEYVDIKKHANDLGMQLICMLDGTPSDVIEVENETYYWENEDENGNQRPIDDPLYQGPGFSTDWEDAVSDHAPLPKEGEPMRQYQNLFIEFAKESDEAVNPNFHSIWIGTQEIAHTIGYKYGVKNLQTKQEAIRRYIDFWKPIAEGIRANGAKVGGIQLNSDNAYDNLYDYAVEYMEEKQLVLDYLTFQFYQWGNEEPMQKAADAVRKYQEIMDCPETKLIVDRGGNSKISDQTKSDAGKFITFLQGEKYCMNEADVVYAYTLDSPVGDFVKNEEYKNVSWQTKYWLMKCGDPESPNKRRELKNLPEGLDGFMTTKGNDLYGVIWNSGVSGLNKKDIELQLTNTQATYTGTPTVYKASGNTVTKVKCKLSNNILSGVTLYSDEYLLIELKADNSGN